MARGSVRAAGEMPGVVTSDDEPSVAPEAEGRPSMSARALACRLALKLPDRGGCRERLAEGFRRAGVACTELPVADGGEGTVDVLCSVFEDVETVDAFGRPRIARTGVLRTARG